MRPLIYEAASYCPWCFPISYLIFPNNCNGSRVMHVFTNKEITLKRLSYLLKVIYNT